MSTMLEADTLLAIDVGSVNTRASLFDVVDGKYRLVATGRAASTGGAPLSDVSEGVRGALEQVQVVTGRKLIDEAESLIMPATSGGAGVDVFVATTSAGPLARTLLVGLMPGVSVEGARRPAALWRPRVPRGCVAPPPAPPTSKTRSGLAWTMVSSFSSSRRRSINPNSPAMSR